MKKIMILAAVVAMAFASQAASFKWTGANIYSSDATTKYTGTASIFAYLCFVTVFVLVKVTDVDVIGGTIKSDAEGAATG